MSQNINLFNPAYRKKRQLLTLTTVLVFAGVTVAGLSGHHYLLNRQVQGLTGELQEAQSLLRAQRGFVEKTKGKTAAVKPDMQLESDITRYETELKIAREAMDALKGGGFGNRQGFAEYLRAFSRQSVNGLWLTGFTIAGNGELEIRGRVLTPELVPSYIQRLNKEEVLAGRSFARLEMSRPQAAAAGKVRDEKAQARSSRFLEFSLVTTDVAKGTKTP